jgi:hypothetical protein
MIHRAMSTRKWWRVVHHWRGSRHVLHLSSRVGCNRHWWGRCRGRTSIWLLLVMMRSDLRHVVVAIIAPEGRRR